MTTHFERKSGIEVGNNWSWFQRFAIAKKVEKNFNNFKNFLNKLFQEIQTINDLGLSLWSNDSLHV